jgi:hypothetical protein
MEKGEEHRFIPKWTEDPHVDGGVYLPLDLDKRAPVPDPKAVPQHVLDIAQATYGRIHKINPPPSPSLSPLRWIPRRYGNGFRFGRPEDDVELELPIDIESPSLIEFRPLLKLPTELQQMIWRHTLPGPRLVEISYDEDTGACTSRCPTPIALWICIESRREAMRFYRPFFATDRAEASIYLDPSVDEFYLGVGNFSPGPRSVLDLFLSLDPKDVGLIQNLAIDSDLANYHEIDEDAPPWGMWWTLSQTSVVTKEEYVFTGLQTLTIHRNSSHSGCNDSPVIGFHGDIILTEAESNPGEFQAWRMKMSGCHWKRNTTVRPVSWDLPTSEATWEIPISQLWSDLERRKYEMASFPLKTVRFVSFGAGPAHWAGRLEFLGGKIYVQSTGCLYERYGVLETLLDWREADGDGSGWYGYLTTQLSEAHDEEHGTGDVFDPILVYLTQTSCNCAIGHAHKAGFYFDDDLDLIDLTKVFKTVRKQKAAGGRPPW